MSIKPEENWRVVKVEYIEAKLTMREALDLKHRLNAERPVGDAHAFRYKYYFKAERY